MIIAVIYLSSNGESVNDDGDVFSVCLTVKMLLIHVVVAVIGIYSAIVGSSGWSVT